MLLSAIEKDPEMSEWQYWQTTPLTARKLYAQPEQDAVSGDVKVPETDNAAEMPAVSECEAE
jgi:hypothetical protein